MTSSFRYAQNADRPVAATPFYQAASTGNSRTEEKIVGSPTPCKQCKIIHHQKLQQKKTEPQKQALEDIAFCTKDFPFLEADDIVEVYNPEEEYPRLLLKIGKGSLRDDFAHRDALSVEQSIATVFQLRAFSDVVVRKVLRDDVELDSVEIIFKDQYLGRSEMWRLKNCLLDTCLYVGKKIEFTSYIRCQVHEMWSHGDKVASGVVTPATKIVFRSSTSMVYLFIQMSSEMWEFDIYGDLYFEKAVNGFLAELFARWKKTGCNHEVTIVLFSRVYYEATNLDQFPEFVRVCLQTDYKGRFYEDFYRIAVQNGKYDDWGNTLIFLKHIFVDYHRQVLGIHKKANGGVKLPKSAISSAARGNFLEVLNMSLNVFEKHFKDRSFDRTGQLSVVITPGVGVFEVDRELTNVTMQRIIDNGVGSDLVCVGEQPLHAVPLLLKFNNLLMSQKNAEDYSMPHWINLSFYSTNKKVGYSSYIPRIKLPILRGPKSQACWDWAAKPLCRIPRMKEEGYENSWSNSVYDYDDYDQRIFQIVTSGQQPKGFQRRRFQHHSTDSTIHQRFIKRQNSEPEIHKGHVEFLSNSINNDRSVPVFPEAVTSSPAITIPAKKLSSALNQHLYSSSFGALNVEIKSKLSSSAKDNFCYGDIWNQKLLSPAASSSLHSGGSPKDKTISYTRSSKESRITSKALINPFDPSHAVTKLTSSRRRWTHIFPRGPTGALIQQHHRHSAHSALEIVHEGLDSPDSGSLNKSLSETPCRSGRNSVTRQGSEGKHTLLWGATGEQEWTPALQTGVDWKSLTIPACLPLTTDYFPDKGSLETDYLLSVYSLLPDDVNADYAQQRVVYREPLKTKEVFAELVSQRLAQGFQLVIRPALEEADKSTLPIPTPFIRPSSSQTNGNDCEEFILSIGRVFHKVELEGSTITVIRFRPKHAYPSLKFHYRYRLNSPYSTNYDASAAVFSTEKLENYSWNYLDHYICTRGDKGFALHESLKYWRFRMYLLPSCQPATKRICEGSEFTNLYVKLTESEKSSLIDNFLKFVEACVNRLRRARVSRKPRGISTSGMLTPTSHLHLSSALPVPHIPGTSYSERLGTIRIERPRAKSGSARDGMDHHLLLGDGDIDGVPYPESVTDSFLNQSNDETTCKEPEVVLPDNTSLRGILDAMCLPNSGFSFVKCGDLPQNWSHLTFVSGDAVRWLISHMEGIESEAQAVDKYNAMMAEKLIVHASGNFELGFRYGFYLYCIIAFFKEDVVRYALDLEMFQDDWMEVEVISRGETIGTYNGRNAPLYKRIYLDVDLAKKSERQEWGHLQYQAKYRPEEAFELVVQWVQATGSVVTELVQGWSRKAQQCNMQLIPIPNDPFAISSSSNSDSLRGPIFIPLDTEGILGNRTFLFEEYPEDTWSERLFEFQESILFQFGFIRCLNPTETGENQHYVHLTGNMFAFIPKSSTDSSRESTVRKRYESPSLMVGSHDEFITRHVSGKRKEGFVEDRRVGFLWSWNYMLSKRWKTSSTLALGDEGFSMKVLRDFQAYCSNQDYRLKLFWETSRGPDSSSMSSEGEQEHGHEDTTPVQF